MGKHSTFYFPFTRPFFIFFFFILITLIAMIEIGIIHYAYEKIGIDKHLVAVLLLLSLLGSYINIPILKLPTQVVIIERETVSYFGIRYVIPRSLEVRATVVAINVGGAIIPTLLSVYLAIKNALYIQSIIGTAIVATLINRIAKPIPGLGIAVPVFIPAILSAVIGILFSKDLASPLAYIVGSLGTLIGADLMNLNKIKELRAPVVSIGGAGTFDGIFLTGILAVLLT
ncbi:MAG: hypothetical protein KatS3mg078_0895 [Deltaproteobacteria bacterium]|jgi:uncharacterized membrane protein|nr:MAG: hypothetical protein KatS3mg078_0895 [Deltaproteobacteria bacterium]